MRNIITLGLILAVCSSAIAAPIDTVFDALHYVEYCEGNKLLDLLSDSFRQQLEFFYSQFLELAEIDPNTASRYLRGSGISLLDLEWMNLGDVTSRILEHMSLPTFTDVVSDSTVFNGDYAETILTMTDSSKIHIYMVFEEAGWKINSSSIITEMLGF